jgi:hypothetical protein
MGVPTSEVGYTSATTRRETMKSIRDMWWYWIFKKNSRKLLYMNLEIARLRGRPRNRWQDEVREDGRIVGEGWQEKVYNR